METVLYRLAVAAGLGFIIGYEREQHGRSAGLKTQIIVAVSSCLLMIISLDLEGLFRVIDATRVTRIDPSRIASYAVAGMGFLGAGAIIQGRGSVQGLTTAASLWAGNAMGLAVGAGFIIPAVASTVLILAILVLLAPLGNRMPRDTYMRIYMDFTGCQDRGPEIRELLREFKIKVIHTGIDCRFDSGRSSYEVAIRLKSTQNYFSIMEALRDMEGMTAIRWTEGHVP